MPLPSPTPPDGRRALLGLEPEALAAWLAERGEPGYRTNQILAWVYKRFAPDAAGLSDQPAALRAALERDFRLAPLALEDERVDDAGRTGKALFRLGDGERVESVWMEDGEGRMSFCISSQAGCPLACAFCATGASGFSRDLTREEVLGQVTALARRAGVLRNVVFMGMGEPLLNLPAVLPALAALLDERRFGLSPRHVTVSTAGIPEGIRSLAASGLRPHLALSLNAPDDALRRRIMPVSLKHPLPVVLDACADYAAGTGRRLLLEYVLLGGLNTGDDRARAVAVIARRLQALVNLIPWNPVEGGRFAAPANDEAKRFRRILEEEGAEVTQRFRRGARIAAACGQLRRDAVGGRGARPAP